MIRLAVRVARAQAELVLAELLELAPGGVEEREEGDVVEYAVYGAAGELPQLPDLRAAAGGALVEIRTEEIADDWDERWKAFHRPLELDGLRVRPPWEPARPDAGIDLVIDPGQAFGTGSHATTRLCLELLLGLDVVPGGFADLGCGSGVLALAAARLGYAPVLASDYDPLAVTATAENAAANGIELAGIARADVRSDPLPEATTAAANILKPILLALAPRLPARPGARLILSGLLAGEADETAAAYAAHGWTEMQRRAGGEWCALLLAGGA